MPNFDRLGSPRFFDRRGLGSYDCRDRFSRFIYRWYPRCYTRPHYYHHYVWYYPILYGTVATYPTYFYDPPERIYYYSYAPSTPSIDYAPPPSGYSAETFVESAPSAPRPSPPAPVDSSAEPAVIREANDLFAQGKYEEASRLYLRAVLTDEQDGVARLLYGLSRFALKDFETAAVAVRGALEATPDLLTDPIDVRSFYASPTEFAAQLDGLKESTGVSFDDQAEARFLLAYLYFASGQPALSAEVLKELLADQPDDKLIVSLNESVQRVLKGQDAAVP